MNDDGYEEYLNMDEKDIWKEEDFDNEVIIDLMHSFDDLFNSVVSLYEVPIYLKSYKAAYDTNDEALDKSTKGNCREFKLAKAFALKACRDCYVDIENYKMASVMNEKYKSYCQKHNLDI